MMILIALVKQTKFWNIVKTFKAIIQTKLSHGLTKMRRWVTVNSTSLYVGTVTSAYGTSIDAGPAFN